MKLLSSSSSSIILFALSCAVPFTSEGFSFSSSSRFVSSPQSQSQSKLTSNLTLNAVAVAPTTDTNASLVAEAANSVQKTIAVTGATGRTGRLVISELLASTNHNIIAIVRDETKAEELFSIDDEDDRERVTIQKCDLLNKKQMTDIISKTGTDQLIWCSTCTGFSSNPNASPIDKLGLIWNAVVNKGENTIDYVGLTCLSDAIEENAQNKANDDVEGAASGSASGPKVIMLSSAGVTRPSWSDAKKERFSGCADIPIVRLNPFNILNIKATSEEKLRQSSVAPSYTIVRPTGLKDDNDWFYGKNARPIFSQGDVAVGRIHRKDVASLLVSCLNSEACIGKTFEVFSIGGYQPPSSADGLEKVLQPLKLDSDSNGSGGADIDENVLEATYLAMQQLLPGETQDAAALAMGQTYEELDEGKVGRLGVKGEEQAESVAPKPSPF